MNIQFQSNDVVSSSSNPLQVVIGNHSVYDDDYLPNSVCKCSIQGVGSISEGFRQQNVALCSFNPTLIQAPTGFGKSHFVIHDLLPYILENGKRMLIVSNRTAVSLQQKQEVMRLKNDPDIPCLTEEGVRRKTDFGSVKIMTLQALPGFINDSQNRDWCESVDLLIIDEAHFFTSDCLFNHNTGWLLRKLPRLFRRAVRIYMTATPEDVLVPLARAEETAGRTLEERLRIVSSPLMIGYFPQLQFYQFSGCGYNHVAVRYFSHIDSLVSLIEKTPSPERWLIFVSSKAEGKKLTDKFDHDAKFISAESKDSKEWKTLINSEVLSCRILVTTTVLDCGMNIHDSLLKHIVILTEDRTTLIQALGRKRCSVGEKINLYVRAVSKQRLNWLKEENDKLLRVIGIVEHYTGNVTKQLFAELWHKGSTSEIAMFRTPYDGALQLDDVAIHKAHRQAYFYKQLEKLLDEQGKSAFPRLVHQWLGQEDGYHEENWLEYDDGQAKQQRMELFYVKYLNHFLLSDEEKKLFSEELVDLHMFLGYKAKRTDRAEFLQERALNNCLSEMKSDCLIEVDRTKEPPTWILKRQIKF